MQIPIIAYRGQTRPWTSIPRINWAHPLTSDLVFYGYDAGGTVLDLVNGGIGKIFSSTTHLTRAASPFGMGFKYGGTGTSDSVSLPLASTKVSTFANTTAPFSQAIGAMGTLNTANGYIVALGSASAGADNTGFAVFTTGASGLATASFNNGGSVPGFSRAFTPGVYHTLISVATTTAAATLYFDGKFDSTFSGTTVNAITAQQVNFNTGQAGAAAFGGGLLGFVYYYAGWTRALTAFEALQLHSDPYCFLIYPEDEVFATLVGATAAPTTNFFGFPDWESIGRQVKIIGSGPG